MQRSVRAGFIREIFIFPSMAIKDLVQIEERLCRAIEKERGRAEAAAKELEQIRAEIQSKQDLGEKLASEREAQSKQLRERMHALGEAERMLAAEESRRRAAKREEYQSSHEEIRAAVSRCELALDKDLPGKIAGLAEHANRARGLGFDNLYRGIRAHTQKRMERLALTVKKDLQAMRIDKVVERVKILNRSISVSAGAGEVESFYVHAYFKEIAGKFSYHFMGGMETNRLDKPEWYLDYLRKELQGSEKILALLNRVDGRKKGDAGEEAGSTAERKANPYVSGIIDLLAEGCVHRKFREVLYSDSPQRANLALHHITEATEFFDQMAERYGYRGQLMLPRKDEEEILSMMRAQMDERIRQVFGRKYTEWVEGVHSLTREAFSHTLLLLRVMHDAQNSLLMYLVNKCLSAIAAFLRVFDYQRREDLEILAYFVEEVTSIEEDLLETEHDLAAGAGREVVLDLDGIYKFREEFGSLLHTVVRERVYEKMRPLDDYMFLEEGEAIGQVVKLAEEIARIRKDTEQRKTAGKVVLETVRSEIEKYLVGKLVPEGEFEGARDAEKLETLVKYIEEALCEQKIEGGLGQAREAIREHARLT